MQKQIKQCSTYDWRGGGTLLPFPIPFSSLRLPVPSSHFSPPLRNKYNEGIWGCALSSSSRVWGCGNQILCILDLKSWRGGTNFTNIPESYWPQVGGGTIRTENRKWGNAVPHVLHRSGVTGHVPVGEGKYAFCCKILTAFKLAWY